ncbi:Protein ripply2 [Dissostichus eleginoides]|uniref:Protein ripply2 n=1 Tax=Dissostichus eleginoides TaxID=100907 RepID=A0AAD9F4T1_DISEL|nr:Protein ripply2 [Dissostichus eleginoides]
MDWNREQHYRTHGSLYSRRHFCCTRPKASQVVHPVKLYWPKSRCFDYLYQDAEMLLRNYPVQATICLYADSSSDEDSNDEEEEMEKELN